MVLWDSRILPLVGELQYARGRGILVKNATEKKHHVYLDKERCKGCRFCIEYCPQHLLYETDETNAKGYHLVGMIDDGNSQCTACDMCTMICPEFAIHVVNDGDDS